MSASATRPVILRRLGVVALAVLGLVVSACGSSSEKGEKPPSGTETRSTPATPTAAATQRWLVTDSETAAGRPAGATVVRLSPDGSLVVVAGGGPTEAYDAATGNRVWQARDEAMSQGATWLAISPDGSAVYVTGTASAESADAAYRTAAYALADGKRLWVASFKTPGSGSHDVASVVATAQMVIVDGVTAGRGSGTSIATVAYDARTGDQKWVAHLDDVVPWFPSGARSLAVDRAGTGVYLTGATRAGEASAMATVAYDTATGERRWLARHESPDGGSAMGSAVAVSPDGATLVATGMVESAATSTDSVTIGYDAATGEQRWVRTYNGPANQNEGTGAVAFRPDGSTVFAAGTSEGATPGHEDMIVLALDPTSGAQRWAVRWDGPAKGDDNAGDLAVAPDGSSVLVVGRTVPAPMKDQYATVALDPGSGRVQWSNTWGIAESGDDNLACHATAVDVAEDGTVFVTGGAGAGTATLAYSPPR
jgi:hypothetical protein